MRELVYYVHTTTPAHYAHTTHYYTYYHYYTHYTHTYSLHSATLYYDTCFYRGLAAIITCVIVKCIVWLNGESRCVCSECSSESKCSSE